MGCRSVAAYRCSSVWRSEAACWQAGSPTSSAQAGRRTFEKARADGTFGKARAKRTFGKVPEPNIEIVRDARSTMKEFRERPHRDQNSTQGAHRSSSKKLFKEALQRSSSEKLFTKKQKKSAFTAVHGSAIEGGCCDSNATVHARGYGQDGD